MTPSKKQEFRAPSQIASAGAALATVSPGALVGTWTNKTSNNVVKAVITDKGGKLEVDIYGACTPSPCNWGVVAAVPYAATVSGGAAAAFNANYSFSFSTVIVIGHLQGAELVLETLTHFTDGSGRADFYFSEIMTK